MGEAHTKRRRETSMLALDKVPVSLEGCFAALADRLSLHLKKPKNCTT